MRVIKGGASKLVSHFDDVAKDINRESIKRVRRGGAYAAKVMRKNASKKGTSTPGGFPAMVTKALKKSLGYSVDKENMAVKVGSRSGKIHLTEFGHGDGSINNRRPLVRPSLLEAEDGAVEIMSKRYW